VSGDNKTLFRSDLAADGGRGHKKAPAPRGPSTDVARGRAMIAAASAAFVGFGLAAIAAPPGGGYLSPGALSPPHARAGLACGACHVDGFSKRTDQALVPSSACTACHGEHAPRRPGHARAMASGAMRCATCHEVHRGEEGVVFEPGLPPKHYATGVEREDTSATSYRADHPVTVALVPVAACAGCHDAAWAVDPAARCFRPGERVSSCLDEHQAPLPLDRPSARATGVCAAQHTSDRPAAWDAALAVARETPLPDPGRRGGAPWLWAIVAAAAACLAWIGARAAPALLARRRAARARAAQPAITAPPARVRLPQIDVTSCLGCSACVDACPYDVLEVDKYVAVVARPEACCGLTLCEQRCPNGSLRITEGEPVGDRPRIDAALESEDVPGLYLAGDITGLPLIKNAIAQGARTVDAIAKARRGRGAAGALDLVIVGAGPAGLSAALRAKELGLAFEVVEQGSVAQSIKSFPRGKLVFDQPLELPVEGSLWLEESTKEELLSHWLRIVRREKLPVVEDTRVVEVAKRGELFHVATQPKDGGSRTERRARAVLLAIGQRGTPRRLPFELDSAVEARVHYHLFDAQSFAGKRVIVVGLGDVAMEAAIALARQPETRVTIVHRGPTFTRGKSRNIAEVKRLAEGGRVALRFSTEIAALSRQAASLCAGGAPESVPYDAVMVLIGSIPPRATLARFGVRTAADFAAPEIVSPAGPSENAAL
jgi:thioredoxin reductase/NAD-dependent dihydropyrimidine dehydrogenase PreA subunit